jgi:hypothetical protein
MNIVKQSTGNVVLTDAAGNIQKVFVNVNALDVKGTDEVIVKFGFNQWHSLFASQIDNTQVEPAGAVAFTGNVNDLVTLLSSSFFFDVAGGGGSPEAIQLAASDETTALTTGTAKVTFRMPFAMTLTAVRASLTTAQASGSIFTVDINQGGSSVLGTKLTIDNTELTSTTAATPATITTSALTDDAEITIDIDQIGDGTATGLKITLIGTR